MGIGVPVPSGRGRLRRSGPPRPGTDRPAGHGKADLCLVAKYVGGGEARPRRSQVALEESLG
jgi:hypothetical protein